MRAVAIATLVLLPMALGACRKPPEQPAAVPPISVVEPPRLVDRPPAQQVTRAAETVQAQVPDADLVLAQAARARLRDAFGTQGAPLLNVTVASGMVTVTARAGSPATQAQVNAALAGLPGANRIDVGTLTP